MELQVRPAGQVCVIVCVIVLVETTIGFVTTTVGGGGKKTSLRNSATLSMAETKPPKYERVSAVERESVLAPVFRGNQITNR